MIWQNCFWIYKPSGNLQCISFSRLLLESLLFFSAPFRCVGFHSESSVHFAVFLLNLRLRRCIAHTSGWNWGYSRENSRRPDNTRETTTYFDFPSLTCCPFSAVLAFTIIFRQMHYTICRTAFPKIQSTPNFEFYIKIERCYASVLLRCPSISQHWYFLWKSCNTKSDPHLRSPPFVSIQIKKRAKYFDNF